CPDPVGPIHRAPVRSLAWSPDGRYLAVGGDDGRIVLLAMDGAQIASWPAHDQALGVLAFAPDSSRLLSIGRDTRPEHNARIWRLPDGEAEGFLDGAPLRAVAAAFSRDGRTVYTGAWDRRIRVAEFRPGSALAPFEEEQGPGVVRALRVSPDGQRLMAGVGNSVRLFRTGDSIELATLSRHRDSIVGGGWI